MGIGDIWNLIILGPMINVLIVLSHYLFGSFGLAIIVITILVRLVTLPLTLQQLKSTKAVQSLQPKLMELQKKFGRDRAKMAQEQMRLYRESGISPVGCMVPMLVQMPVWIALFQSVVRVSAVVPEDFLNLSQHLYSAWEIVFTSVPLASRFLWLNLAQPDPYLILPILVGASMWVQQKMVTPPAIDPRQAQQSRMMLWMMPMMFAFMTLQFPSGLAVYWLISNIISVVIQYYVTGWGELRPQPAAPAKGDKYTKRIIPPGKKAETISGKADIQGPEPKKDDGEGKK